MYATSTGIVHSSGSNWKQVRLNLKLKLWTAGLGKISATMRVKARHKASKEILREHGQINSW